ncbi:MAG: NAD(P)H-hydrate epimerase [Candidatus Aenigmarchaeota archaeon]|nr:NAD(P)H-hydrate epimerase [Candidatus Aenigmarchaeota archaeon]
MAKIDSLAPQYGISLESMMEKAGLHTAELARRLLGKDYKSKTVCHLAGKGNNGGDAVASARHLALSGVKNILLFSHPFHELKEAVKAQILALPKENVMAIGIDESKSDSDIMSIIRPSDLIIDGLIGYNLKGEPRGEAARLIEAANNSGRTVLSIDVPSGLDSDTGRPSKHTIKARATLTLALPKRGLMEKEARKHIGNLYAGDIGIPPWLYRQIGVDVGAIFSAKSVVKIY